MSRGCHIPWIALLSALVAGAGIGLWVHYSRRAINNTESILNAMEIDTPTWWSWTPIAVYIAMAVATTVMAITLVISLSRTCLPKHKRGGKRTLYLWSSSFINFLLWLVVLLVVLLVGWYCVWFSATVVLDRASVEGAKLARRAVGVTQDMNQAIDELLKTYFTYQNQLPTEVKDVFGPQIDQIRAFRNQGNATCAKTCLDLSVFGDILPAFGKCICAEETLREIRLHSQAASKNLFLALVGLLLTYVGMSWMVMRVVAEFTKTQITGKEQKAQEGSLAYYKPGPYGQEQYLQG